MIAVTEKCVVKIGSGKRMYCRNRNNKIVDENVYIPLLHVFRLLVSSKINLNGNCFSDRDSNIYEKIYEHQYVTPIISLVKVSPFTTRNADFRRKWNVIYFLGSIDKE